MRVKCHLLLLFVVALFAIAFMVGCGSGTGIGSSIHSGGGSGGGSVTVAPTIIKEPASQTVPLGKAATFTVSATGTGPLSYQWLENGTPVTGAATNSYTTAAVTAGDSGEKFAVTVSNSVGTITSEDALLSVGPRSPQAGDLRFQQVDAPSAEAWNSHNGNAVASDLLGGSSAAYTDAIGAPLSLGGDVCYPGIQGDCAWQYAVAKLPSGLPELNMHYQSGEYENFETDFTGEENSNSVLTSVDFEPEDGLYAFSIIQSNQAEGFNVQEEVSSPANIQAMAEKDGTQSRVITAVSFDNQGQVHLFSYSWKNDASTVYDAKTMLVSTGDVALAAKNLADGGYIITAFGGNDSDGYVLVGTRVHGDTMPRSIIEITTTSSASQNTDGYAPVITLSSPSIGDLIVWEK